MSFKWPNGVGFVPCICSCGHELTRDEVETTRYSGGCGTSRLTAKVKCLKCGQSGNDGDWGTIRDIGYDV
jgi:hypothetical protein